VFGLGALVQYSTAAVVSLAVGAVLDRDPDLYRWVYPVLGATGFVYLLVLARLPRPAGDATPDPEDVFVVPRLPLGSVQWRRLAAASVAPFREALATFRADGKFLWFETNFMIYGIAYLMLIPVMPLFFTQELNLTYREISSARVLIASLGMAMLGPAMGRLMDRIHPVRLCTISFGIIGLYPLALAVGAAVMPDRPALTAYVAFAFYAVGMAGINVTWNVGSISFAPEGQGGYYQGIHVAMVGIRGLLGPLMGFALLTLASYRVVFGVSAAIFLVSSISSAVLGRRLRDTR
jgi:MFS family permease